MSVVRRQPQGVRRLQCRLVLPLWHPAGGLPGWSSVLPAVPAPGGGLTVFVACLPCLLLAFLPPSPPPPSPAGKGEIFVILLQGASRLASPRAGGARHWFGGRWRRPAGAYRLCRLSTLPFAYFPAPIPLTPFPAGRGKFLLSYARGFAPCIPGAGGARHWFGGRWRRPAGLARLVAGSTCRSDTPVS